LSLTTPTPHFGATEADPTASLVGAIEDTHAALGTDWPFGSLDPVRALEALMATVEPAAAAGQWSRSQREALENALEAYTAGAAWASFDEGRKGTIETGMLADLVVLSTDIFDAPAGLASARVSYTIFDGKIVYRADRGTN
jgi:predicted amidohydrolase YtcJ